MFKVFGVVLLVMALAIAIIPNFTDCNSQGKFITMQSGKTTDMKCHWTGKAEIAVAVPIFGIGALLTFNRRRQSLMNLSAMGIILGAFAIALPTNHLIGVCGTPGMICNSVMKPSLTALGAVVTGVSLFGVVLSSRMKKD